MAPTHAKTDSGASRSCLDILAASGYVWGAVDEEQTENRVVRDDDFERKVDLLKIASMWMFAPH